MAGGNAAAGIRPSRSGTGFTLVEVLVALSISGIVLLAAAEIFRAVGDAGREVRAARVALDREMNARRWLASAFLSLEVGQTNGASFEGRVDQVSFSTWQLVPGGWMEPRRIELACVGTRLQAQAGSELPLVLADSVSRVAFDYLLEPGLTAAWVREWISPVSAPIAVRIRIERGTTATTDTLLLLIKERG